MANSRWLIVKNRRTILLRYQLRQGYEGQESYGGQGDDNSSKK